MEKNLTTGSVLKTVLYFSLPYLLSYFLQTLYGMADLFIIGQFNSVESTTAVSIGSQVMHMVTVVIVGLAMGSTVMISRCVGAGNRRQASNYIGNTAALFLAFSLILTAVLTLLVNPIISTISTPAEAVPQTRQYLMICFIGIPFITAYNIISSIFRGIGDSKSPMWFIAVACAANIGLDFLFIGVFKMGAAGAALGTTLAQLLSVAVSLVVIFKRNTGIRLKKSDFVPKKTLMASLLKIGIPIALQDGFVQVAFLVITMIANSRGLNDAAAVGIVEKLIGILFLVPSSMLSTVSAIGAQNVGAGKHDRASLTLRYSVIIAVSWGALCVIVMQLFSEPFISLFTDSQTVVNSGAEYMRGYVFDCIMAGIHFCFSGYFCAYGLSAVSFVHNMCSIMLARIPLVYLASNMFPDTLLPMGIATTLGSLLSVLICIGVYVYLFRKRKKQNKA